MARTIKVGDSATVYFDIRLENSNSPALNEAGGQPQTLLNAGSFDNTGISTLTSLGFGRYSAVLNTGSMSVTVGDVILTRYKGPTTAETAGDTFAVVSNDGTLPDDVQSVAYYGTIGDADVFFNSRLNTKKWSGASPDDKRRALTQSTQLIDRLNFSGDKVSQNQSLQFPRQNTYTDLSTGQSTTTTDTNVPTDIKFATYLVAYKLLEGYDPEREARALAMNMQKYQSAQTVFERKFIPDYQVAGIPSAEAWGYLRPYLRDARAIEFSRI